MERSYRLVAGGAAGNGVAAAAGVGVEAVVNGPERVGNGRNGEEASRL
jgi:hypothetical protein